MKRIAYDEFSMFHENAQEYGIPYSGPPTVRRDFVEVEPGRRLSALIWGEREPEIVFLHGGGQNAHTWDTIALALGRPLVAIDLPGHGHSDQGRNGSLDIRTNAPDIATAVCTWAPNARGVVGMSLGGMTTLALVDHAPELVRSIVLVDVTPGVRSGSSVSRIAEFLNGPESFDSFDDLLARTIKYNPTRTESSLRRGILHNAMQRDDRTWVWRHQRFRSAEPRDRAIPDFGDLWDVVSHIQVPLLLCRGMREESIVVDDDEVELLRRLPNARVEHFDEAGHSIQGDMPVELAKAIDEFIR